MLSAISIAATPKRIETPRQPTSASSGAPITATSTVPTLPPAIWALIANPRRSGGYCSANRPLPTGCCGELPMRAVIVGGAKVAKLDASDIAANPPPNRSPPNPRRRLRDT